MKLESLIIHLKKIAVRAGWNPALAFVQTDADVPLEAWVQRQPDVPQSNLERISGEHKRVKHAHVRLAAIGHDSHDELAERVLGRFRPGAALYQAIGSPSAMPPLGTDYGPHGAALFQDHLWGIILRRVVAHVVLVNQIRPKSGLRLQDLLRVFIATVAVCVVPRLINEPERLSADQEAQDASIDLNVIRRFGCPQRIRRSTSRHTFAELDPIWCLSGLGNICFKSDVHPPYRAPFRVPGRDSLHLAGLFPVVRTEQPHLVG